MSRRTKRAVANLAVLAGLGIWFLTLAPTAIGGPAAFIEVSGQSMSGTYESGDLVVTRARSTYSEGDIVVFRTDSGGQVIHRIIGGDGRSGYTLQGDNNPDPDPWHPTDADVVGSEWIHLPQKAWMMHLPREPWFAGLSAGLATLLVLGWDARPRRRTAAAQDPAAPEVLVPAEGDIVVPSQRGPGSPPGAVPPAVRRGRSPSVPADDPAVAQERS